MIHTTSTKKGFTLIEILVVMGIIGILATVVLVAVNPSRQFKQARDSQRIANVNTILNAVGQNMADHQGEIFCDGSMIPLPTEFTRMKNDQDATVPQFDIAECLIPEYISKLPFDPGSQQGGYFTTEDDYNTGYSIMVDGVGRVVVRAEGELSELIEVSR